MVDQEMQRGDRQEMTGRKETILSVLDVLDGFLVYLTAGF
jgi:hypothetical protein